MSKAGRLEERPLRWLGVETHRGWDLKTYSITRPAQTLDDAALPAAREELARLEPASAPGATGVVIVHQGAEALWLGREGMEVGDMLVVGTVRSAGRGVGQRPRERADEHGRRGEMPGGGGSETAPDAV